MNAAFPRPGLLAIASAAFWKASVASPGGLTIVVQGPVHSGNAPQVEVNLRHWRRLFRNARIVLSLSSNAHPALADPKSVRRREVRGLLGRSPMRDPAVVRRLSWLCDEIVLAEPEAPLPPLKFGETAPNHGNLQIGAARAGLARARSAWTLRVRNDLLFADRTFLDFYRERASLPRRTPSGFESRVLISHLFTLNPFASERLPFHLSDFFHFGRTEDVRSIWMGLPRLGMGDATYYETHDHAGHSNPIERRFRARLAVEQHIHFPLASSRFPAARLDRHNDNSSVHDSVAMLVNDFVLCDMTECGALFPKWGHLFSDPAMRRLCVTADDWVELAGLPSPGERAAYLKRERIEEPARLRSAA